MSTWYAAAGDCEQVRSELLGQPANTVTAAGYLLAGGWLLVWVCRRPSTPHRYRWFAAAVVANGIGSGLYHGPGWPGSGASHDIAAIAVAVFVAVDGLGGVRGWHDRSIARVALTTTALAAAVVLAWPATNIALLTAVTAAVVAEAAVARQPTAPAGASTETPPAAHRPRRPARVVMLTALAVGLTAYLLGRTGGPLCWPSSLLQPHALWHLLTAVAMATWAADRIAHPVQARAAAPRR